MLLPLGHLALKDRTAASHGAAGSPSTLQAKPSPEASPASRSPEPDTSGTAREKVRPSSTAIPSSGPGTFDTAGGSGAAVGGNERTLTYTVQVEDGIGIAAADVAAEVERVLADPRGWTADGRVGFRRVSGGTSDFRVRLATAGTVDRICGEYGLDTGGEVNCSVGKDVMVNLKRWLLATQYYTDDVTSYRALIINHEVGHFLGHGHETCPGAGRPAPVMMQQIKGLHGCRTNVWPYDDDGRPVTGPAVP
ncbi:membrane protein [Streptomyces fumigatiscleroticus]|nr:membrane protein [Streptomyces fumigatiscleroticus]